MLVFFYLEEQQQFCFHRFFFVLPEYMHYIQHYSMLFNLDAGTCAPLFISLSILSGIEKKNYSLCAGHFASFAESTSMHGSHLRGTVHKLCASRLQVPFFWYVCVCIFSFLSSFARAWKTHFIWARQHWPFALAVFIHLCLKYHILTLNCTTIIVRSNQ